MKKTGNDMAQTENLASCASNMGATTPGTNTTQRKRGLARFSIRRLLCASPLGGRRIARSSQGSSSKSHNRTSVKDTSESRVASSSKEPEVKQYEIRPVGRRQYVASSMMSPSDLQKATSRSSVFTTSTMKSNDAGLFECPLCLAELSIDEFTELMACGHRSCNHCLQQYLRIEISESRVSIACPECSEPMHPNEIRSILNDQTQYEKYEDFMVRRVLAVDPDTRWCPAPDCSFAVVAAGCASCPKLHCERPGCDFYFCYHCKAEWHPNQTCDAARAQRSPNVRSSSVSFSQDSRQNDIKPCPRCQVLIVKMEDGSCNHMMCAVCGAEFCWLCMKEISDLHYLSPSGCTFWGKKPWSRKKKILWQLGTLVGAPVGIALVAGIAIPAMIIGIPVWVGRKLYTRYRITNKHKRNAAIIGGVTASVLVSPVLAGLAVGIGVPILLFYVYGVVPVSLCRSGGCGVSTSGAGVKFEFDDENDLMSQISTQGSRNPDNTSIDAVSNRGGNPSIGEVSISIGSGIQLARLGGVEDHDSNTGSNVALAGSIASNCAPGSQRLEVQADIASTQRFSMSSETASAATSLSEKSVNASIDDGTASTRALAGSMLNYKPSGVDSSSCCIGVGSEDCVSERVRFDDNVSFIAPHNFADKISIGSGRSWRSRSSEKAVRHDEVETNLESQKKLTFANVDKTEQLHDSQKKLLVNVEGSSSLQSCQKKAALSLDKFDGLSTTEESSDDVIIEMNENEASNTRPLSAAAALRLLFFSSTTPQFQHEKTNANVTNISNENSGTASTSLPVIPEPTAVSSNDITIDISLS